MRIKNKISKSIVGILLGAMFIMSIPMPGVKAEEVQPEIEEKAVNATEEIVSNEEEVINKEPENLDSLQTEDVLQKVDSRLNYIYIESPYLKVSETQNVVISWGDGSEDISAMRLVYQKNNEEYGEWECSVQQEELFLFSWEIKEETAIGTYNVTAIRFTQNGEEREFRFDTSDTNVEFEVSMEHEVYPLAEMEQAPAMSVMTLNENGSVEGQDSIEEALEDVTEGNPVSLQSDIEYSRNTKAEDDSIVVALDAGHDHLDAGANYNGLAEEILTLKIANYCKKELEEYAGVKVYMTRTSNQCPVGVTTYPHAGACIWERVKRAAEAGADIFVSLHLNASVASSAHGAEVIIPNTSWKPELNSEGQALAEKILAELSTLGLEKRGIYYKNATDGDTYQDGSIGDYFAVQNAGKEYSLPGIIVEHAFISNQGSVDQNLVTSEAGLKSLGVADAKGIATYLGAKKGFWEKVGDGYKFNCGNNNYLKEQWLRAGGWYYLDADGFRVSGWRNIGGSRYYFSESGRMLTGWRAEGDKWYYLNKDGSMQKGWKYIGQFYYYFDDSGEMVTGWHNIGIFKYYFGPSGNMYIGWQTIDGKKYYFGPSGNMYTGQQIIDGKICNFGNDGVFQGEKAVGWQKEEDVWYYYNEDGSMQKGWKYIGQFYYYFDDEGKMLTGWQTVGIFKYYFGPSGNMYIGWQTIDGKKYYFGPSGNMYTGQQTINGKVYYFGNDGVLKEKTVGWQKEGDVWYYYNEDGSMQKGWKYIGQFYYYFDDEGKMLTGWQTVGIFKYYFGPSGNMYIGWQTIDGKKYYFGPSGNMYTGQQTINGKVYYFGNDGVLKEKTVGWQKEGDVWYYYNEDGSMQKGWKYIGQFYYYFDDEGKMLTGWQTVGIFKYYFGPSGNMYIGWQTIDGKKYYFGPSGNMYTGQQIIDGKICNFGNDGVLQGEKAVGWQKEGDIWYYYNEDGSMQKGWKYIGRFYYYFDDEGKMLTGWQTVGIFKYYFGPSGNMYIGWQTIDGKKYYFGPSGNMYTGQQIIDGKICDFGNDGVFQGEKAVGWQKEGDVWYYYNEDGSMQKGWKYIGQFYYYFDDEGKMLTGWQTVGNSQYYFGPSGNMYTGWKDIEGVPYYFQDNGVLTDLKPHEIMGTTMTTVDKMEKLFNSSGKSYPSKELTKGGAPTLEDFCKIYIEEAKAENVKAEVAFAQAMLETGYLQFGGDVAISQYNFAGLGATGNGVPGNSFKNVRIGVRAQIQHLKAYASKEPLNQECVDVRYQYVATKGCSPYVEWLGQKENPFGLGWAASVGYGNSILKLMNQL